MSERIPLSQWITFNTRWLKNEFKGQRFGQAFCNEFNYTDPDIFYNTDHIKVVNDCLVKYVDTSVVGGNYKSRNAVVVPKEKLDTITSRDKI